MHQQHAICDQLLTNVRMQSWLPLPKFEWHELTRYMRFCKLLQLPVLSFAHSISLNVKVKVFFKKNWLYENLEQNSQKGAVQFGFGVLEVGSPAGWLLWQYLHNRSKNATLHVVGCNGPCKTVMYEWTKVIKHKPNPMTPENYMLCMPRHQSPSACSYVHVSTVTPVLLRLLESRLISLRHFLHGPGGKKSIFTTPRFWLTPVLMPMAWPVKAAKVIKAKVKGKGILFLRRSTNGHFYPMLCSRRCIEYTLPSCQAMSTLYCGWQRRRICYQWGLNLGPLDRKSDWLTIWPAGLVDKCAVVAASAANTLSKHCPHANIQRVWNKQVDGLVEYRRTSATLQELQRKSDQTSKTSIENHGLICMCRITNLFSPRKADK